VTIADCERVYIRSVDHQTANSKQRAKPARGFAAVGIFLLFGMSMAGLAGTTLLWRGTFLDRIWALNPTAYTQLAPMSRIIGAAFLFLAVALGGAAVGWFLRRLWGWGLAVAIISIQVVGDLMNLLRGDFVRGLIGILVAGALLIYLLRVDVKGTFLPDQSGL
jgi:hypothetical protein